jgi:hypothetical protein
MSTLAENRAIAGTTLENKFITILITFEAKFSKNNNTKMLFLAKS